MSSNVSVGSWSVEGFYLILYALLGFQIFLGHLVGFLLKYAS